VEALEENPNVTSPLRGPDISMWVLRSGATCDAGGLTFRLSAGSVRTVGRAVRADFIVDAALVSRVHCRLTADERDHLRVEDLGSTNGTFVNDRRVRQAVLAPGDRLRVGPVELVVARDRGRAEPETSPLAEAREAPLAPDSLR
jgi:pSer/pThr/pTyr-binding forkhead associated (FHA) protein